MAPKLRQHRSDRAADLCGVDTYRRNSAVDAAVMLAVSGGYEAVQVRAVAAQVGIGVSTLYRYFPSKIHLLVSALTREFQEFGDSRDWTVTASTPRERLRLLVDCLHAEWQQDPRLTEAVTRAFVLADHTAATATDQAIDVIEGLLARTLSGGEPTVRDQRLAGLIADVWLANLAAFSSGRISGEVARDRIDRAIDRFVDATHGDPEVG